MGIHGDNNRVAGRDYHEYSGKLELTAEQLRMLGVVPCPRCEKRVIQVGSDLCNHCHREIRKEASHAILARYGAVALFLWGCLITFAEKEQTPISLTTFLQLGAAAAFGVFVLSQVLAVARDLWQMNGAHIKRASVKAITRIIKG